MLLAALLQVSSQLGIHYNSHSKQHSPQQKPALRNISPQKLPLHTQPISQPWMLKNCHNDSEAQGQ